MINDKHCYRVAGFAGLKAEHVSHAEILKVEAANITN